MQRRAVRRAVEGAAQRLAVDGQHPRPVRPKIGQKCVKRTPEGLRIEQPEHPREGVVARQAVLQPQEFPQQRRAVPRELREVHATLRPAHRRHQRDGQDVQQIMSPRVAAPRVRHLPENRDQRSHGLPLQEDPYKISITSKRQPHFSNAIPLAPRCGGAPASRAQVCGFAAVSAMTTH